MTGNFKIKNVDVMTAITRDAMTSRDWREGTLGRGRGTTALRGGYRWLEGWGRH